MILVPQRHPPDSIRELAAKVQRALVHREHRYGHDPMRWGVVLIGAVHLEDPQFWVVTEGGAALVLTYRLLHALETTTVSIYGALPALVDTLDRSRDLDEPVRTLRLTVAIAPEYGDLDDFVDLRSTLTPTSLSTGRLVCLTRRRPEGWPQ